MSFIARAAVAGVHLFKQSSDEILFDSGIVQKVLQNLHFPLFGQQV